MPFGVPWTDVPPDQVARSVLQHHLRQLGGWSAQDWTLNLVVDAGGAIAGTQGISGRDFAVLREVHTGSWLGQRYQRQGIGTEMRAAVLELAFTGLGAEYATSEAFTDNAASLGVSRKLGYAFDGIYRQVIRGSQRRSTGCAWTGRRGGHTVRPRWRSPGWPNACPTSASPANPGTRAALGASASAHPRSARHLRARHRDHGLGRVLLLARS
jgi:RimJ/RimL family protein N-acetyltransferase